jgi:carbohydrate diacid regulator
MEVVMTNNIFQSFIYQFKDVVDRKIGVCDSSCTIVACTDPSMIGQTKEEIVPIISGLHGFLTFDGYTYKTTLYRNNVEYMVFCEGVDEEAKKTSTLISISLASIKRYYDEKFDKESFIKNIILDKILPSDILTKTKEMHLQNEVPRVVFIIRKVSKDDVVVTDVVQSLFPEKDKNFIITIAENDYALVREVKDDSDVKDYEQTAKIIINTLAEETLTDVLIGIGTKVNNIKDLANSYKEAKLALEVGQVFETEKSIVNYENLGLGRLIYQLPTTLCEKFLAEVFKKNSLDVLDQETIFTIKKFFENNLNVSETARKLFVHRNTLVYRLDKIKKLTGLDLRNFDQAIVFKVAMMVNSYLVANPLQL